MNLRISQLKVRVKLQLTNVMRMVELTLMCDVDWTEENTDLPSGNTHLWEESWDDDDTNDDFSAQLK
jgi:hypothetical protein